MDYMDISNTQLTTQNISQMEVDEVELDFYNAGDLHEIHLSGTGDVPAGGFHSMGMDGGLYTIQGSPMDTVTQDTQLRTQSYCEGARPVMVPLPGFNPSSRHCYLNSQSLHQLSEKVLGTGSFGNVTVGILTDRGGRSREVAIKHAQSMSRSEACKALKKEMAVFERIPSHENIVEYIGGRVGPPGDGQANANEFFIVEELLPGNLSDLVHVNLEFAQRCTYRDLLMIFHGIVSGLSHLHTHNVIHHDLKPANVLVAKDMNPKLADFGASTIRLRRTITATIRGTPGYIAPEAYYGGLVKQLSGGKVKVNESIDIFSLGAIMWECIVREPIGGPANSQLTQTQESFGKQSAEADDEPCIYWGGLTRVKCNCPKPLRDLVESCLQFDHASIESMDFKRPSCESIKLSLQQMLNEDWVCSRPPWSL